MGKHLLSNTDFESTGVEGGETKSEFSVYNTSCCP